MDVQEAPPAPRDDADVPGPSERLAFWQVEVGDNILHHNCVSVSGTIKRLLKLRLFDIVELRLRVRGADGAVRGETRQRIIVTSVLVARHAFNIRVAADEAKRLAIKEGETLDVLLRAMHLPVDPPPPPETVVVYQRLLGAGPSPLTLAGPNFAGGGAGPQGG